MMSANNNANNEPQQQQPHDFFFLSATQILQLDELTSRQVLACQPIKRNIHRDPALVYIFVSHRWEEPANPDASGQQLTTLKSILRLVERLLVPRPQPSKQDEEDGGDGSTNLLKWPTDVTELTEGVPQAASLVARIQAKIKKANTKKNDNDDEKNSADETMMLLKKMMTMEDNNNPLDHIYLWYDCACLPQKVPHPRTDHENSEFKNALQHLDWLVRNCELLCLRIPHDEYNNRAWCAFEHFTKQTVDFEGDIMVDCQGMEHQERFDWHLENEEEDADNDGAAQVPAAALPPGLENMRLPAGMPSMEVLLKRQQERQRAQKREVRKVMRETQQTQLNVAQGSWKWFVNSRKKDQIPDLVRKQYQVRRATATAEPFPPLQQAMEQLTRELFQVLYCMSCRDAAALHQQRKLVPADHNACVDDCGIQCGLHQGNTPEQAARLLRIVQEGGGEGNPMGFLQFVPVDVSCEKRSATEVEHMHCSKKHRLIPNVACTKRRCDNRASCPLKDREIPAGSVYVGCLPCDYDLCYACAMSRMGHPVEGDGTSQAPRDEYEAAGVPRPSDFERMSGAELIKLVTNRAKKKEPKKQATDDDGTSQAALDAILEAYGSTYPENNASNTQSAEPVLVERKVTLDLYELSSKMLARFGLKCTNDGDAAFVGLLALRNFLQGGNKASDKTGLRLTAGLVTHILGVIEAAVDHFAVRLAEGVSVPSLVAAVTIRAPRWVFLDLANSTSPASANLLSGDIVTLSGVKAQEYLSQNPDCVTHSLEPYEAPSPVPVQFCEFNDKCNCIWSQCMHQAQQIMTAQPRLALVHSTLDSWAMAKLPIKLCHFGCTAVWNEIFVIGGATGEWNEETKLYEGCLDKTYVGTFNDQGANQWKDLGLKVRTPRYYHQCCAIEDERGQPTMIAISGGQDAHGRFLSSLELLRLDPKGYDAGWLEDPTMPVARKGHRMVCLGNCLFLFAGKMEDDDVYRLKECNIYNLSTKSWSLGPCLTEPFRGGDAVVVFNRYIVLVGGISPANQPIEKAWVLDAKPWIEWSSSGVQEQKPDTMWMPGPAFPHPVMIPNLTVIPTTATKDGVEWILSVGSDASGNAVYGIRLPPFGLNSSILWSRLQWQQLGLTPDIFVFGKCVVVDGMLAMIGGDRYSTNKTTDTVHYRRLLLEDDEGEGSTTKASGKICVKIAKNPPICGTNPVEQKGFFYHPEANYLALNDGYLTGRLGFPLAEEALFSPNGMTKKLITLRPALESKRLRSAAPLHCQRCLIRTRSLDAARANLHACHFGLRVQSPGIRIPLCSSCLCALYHDGSALKQTIEPPERAPSLSADTQEERFEIERSLLRTHEVATTAPQTDMGQETETDLSANAQLQEDTVGRDEGKAPDPPGRILCD